jgi:hypothetical protein
VLLKNHGKLTKLSLLTQPDETLEGQTIKTVLVCGLNVSAVNLIIGRFVVWIVELEVLLTYKH